MMTLSNKLPHILLTAVYTYLALPVLIFFLFWLKRPIGIPAALLVVLGVVICCREHQFPAITSIVPRTAVSFHKGKIAAVFLLVTFWVILSGIGGYVWQNSDHSVRNEIFQVMVEQPWPVYSNTPEHTPLVYYIGFWLPSAAVGKLFGIQAGWLFQVLWTIGGILLCYALICLKRKKISLWPLLLFICFSGLDVVGTMLVQTDKLDFFGSAHLEWWATQFQFSSMTTQLFWVFNQAVPAWLACTFLFLYERPKNIFFTLSLLPLVSTFPFVGMVPFGVYFLFSRSQWKQSYTNIRQLAVDIRHNLISIQNTLIPLAVCVLTGLYLLGNQSVSGTVSLLYTGDGAFRGGILLAFAGGFLVLAFAAIQLWIHGKRRFLKIALFLALAVLFLYLLSAFDAVGWWYAAFLWVHLTVFYFLEAGGFLAVLYPFVREKKLFWVNALWLYLIPVIRVGYGFDFCMRASIPGLLLILLWCIDAFDSFILKAGTGTKVTDISPSDIAAGSQQTTDAGPQQELPGLEQVPTPESVHIPLQIPFLRCIRKEHLQICLLAILLLLGAATPFHEIKRTYINTVSYYELETLSEEKLYQGSNVCGNPDSFFWKYLAR